MLDSDNQIVLVVLSALLIVVPGYILREEWSRNELASPLALYCALIILHFGLPGLFFVNPDIQIVANSANSMFAVSAQALVICSLLAFWAGYHLTARKAPKRVTNQTVWSERTLFVVIVAFSVVGWITRLYIIANNGYFQMDRTTQGDLEGNFYAAIRLLEVFPLHVVFILSIHYWSSVASRSNFSWGNLLLLSVLLELVYWLPTGRKEETIYVLLMPALIRYLFVHRLPSRSSIILSIVFIGAIFPFAFYYRYAMEMVGTSGESLLTVVTESVISAGSTGIADDVSAIQVIFGRLSLIEPVAACIRLINQDILKMSFGSSYSDVLYSLVPRFIWDTKPVLSYGNDFGYAAGFLGTDMSTSISVTYIGESFLNFGWGGWIVGLPIGLFFGWIYNQIHISNRAQTWCLLYILALPSLLFVGGTFGLFYGGLMKLLPFYYVIGIALSGKPSSSVSYRA